VESIYISAARRKAAGNPDAAFDTFGWKITMRPKHRMGARAEQWRSGRALPLTGWNSGPELAIGKSPSLACEQTAEIANRGEEVVMFWSCHAGGRGATRPTTSGRSSGFRSAQVMK
jgi:hypothetical protein